MRLTRIYVRFYKSFNFDYERKAHRDAKRDPWEELDGAWYPFVRLDLDPAVTTVVGANESGKSHLLDAVEKLINGVGIERSDFCRYSGFFSVERGKMRMPDFGGEFEVTSVLDEKTMSERIGLKVAKGDRFHLFRLNGAAPVAFLKGQKEPTELSAEAVEALKEVLPAVFRLRENLPLPASIPLYELAKDARKAFGDRRRRRSLLETLFGRSYANEEELKAQVPNIYPSLAAQAPGQEDPNLDAQYEIGRDLVFLVAEIDDVAFKDLDDALAAGNEGYVEGVVQKINHALARHLNFPRWWAQDRDFRLRVAARDSDLVFTIHDRTGTDYSFIERSQGLKFFLSYYVQLLARRHRAPADGQAQILLMDEPDAYLSSQGQQDLLRILEVFARPEDRSREDQVVYVTHSPFLINRNAAQRIRVLDKGVGEEGTRIVKDVARNHYEPLRSSLGAYVAETAFIGGTNLFVEGPADQVLLAGFSTHLRASGASSVETLDLNEITIVPSGSAESIPYMVYLARGRDEVKPPCVALLDGDSEGKKAARALKRGGARGRQVLADKYVVELDVWAAEANPTVGVGVIARELEDLVALEVAVAACRAYARNVLGISDAEADELKVKHITDALGDHDGSLWDATRAAFAAKMPDSHIEKVGFAKEVIAFINGSRAGRQRPIGLPATEANFRAILSELTSRLRVAKQDEDNRRLNNRVTRLLDAFLDDHPYGTSRDQGRFLLDDLLGALDDTEDSDRIRVSIASISREFKLDENLTEQIERFDEFRTLVNGLRYEPRFAHQDAVDSKEATPGGPPPTPASAPKRPARRRAAGVPVMAAPGEGEPADEAVATATGASSGDGEAP
jgi:predicted ATPase